MIFDSERENELFTYTQTQPKNLEQNGRIAIQQFLGIEHCNVSAIQCSE